jgi:hypothetical protein
VFSPPSLGAAAGGVEEGCPVSAVPFRSAGAAAGGVLSSRCCPFQELQELAWKRVAAVQQLQLFRLGVAAGLLLALKEGTSKGRQEGEVQAAIQQLWSCYSAALELERIT